MSEVVAKEKTIEDFIAFAKFLTIGMIAVLDEPNYPIFFASRIEPLLGYADEELKGKPLGSLLPNSVHANHGDWMQNLKTDKSKARQMAGNRKVPAIAKNGDPVPVYIGIDPEIPGYFIALLQGEDRQENAINAAEEFIDKVLKPSHEIVEKTVKQTKAAIAAQVAAKGGGAVGVIGLITWLLTQITPLGTALKSARSAFFSEAPTPVAVTSGTSNSAITDDMRTNRLVLIRNALASQRKPVIATAYFNLKSYEFGSTELDYLMDSKTSDGKEVWFFDYESEPEDAITLSAEERMQLSFHNCFKREDGAYLPKNLAAGKLVVIYCPTFKIIPDPSQPLIRTIAQGVSAVALPANTPLEPTASALWQYGPNLERVIESE